MRLSKKVFNFFPYCQVFGLCRFRQSAATYWSHVKKTVACGIAAESYYLMLQDINCKQIYYVISPFSFITTKIVWPHGGLEHRTPYTLSENLTTGLQRALLQVIIAVYINRLKSLLLKTNCVTDRYPGLLYFYTTVSLDRLEFDSQDVFNNPSGSSCIKTKSPRWRREESNAEPQAPSARIRPLIQQTI